MKISSVDLHVGTNSVNSEPRPKSMSKKLYSHAEDATVDDVDVDVDDEEVAVALLVSDVIVFDN